MAQVLKFGLRRSGFRGKGQGGVGAGTGSIMSRGDEKKTFKNVGRKFCEGGGEKEAYKKTRGAGGGGEPSKKKNPIHYCGNKGKAKHSLRPCKNQGTRGTVAAFER